MSTSESVIQFTSRTARTLVDGTLRLSVDIEPSFANAAFKLFSMPGTPGAIAALTNESAQAATMIDPLAKAVDATERAVVGGTPPADREAVALNNLDMQTGIAAELGFQKKA